MHVHAERARGTWYRGRVIPPGWLYVCHKRWGVPGPIPGAQGCCTNERAHAEQRSLGWGWATGAIAGRAKHNVLGQSSDLGQGSLTSEAGDLKPQISPGGPDPITKGLGNCENRTGTRLGRVLAPVVPADPADRSP